MASERASLPNNSSGTWLSVEQCAAQFELYAKDHPDAGVAHGLRFCAEFLRDFNVNVPAPVAQPSTTPSVEGWQAIETAPKDGTRVLLWWPYWCSTAITARYYEGQWRAEEVLDEVGDGPTHWMPLPPAPTSSSVGSEVTRENDSDS